MKVYVVLVIFVAFASAWDDRKTGKAHTAVLQLNDNNFFHALAPGNGKYFVRFYTSLCQVCQNFTSEWVKVGEAVSDDSRKIQVGDFNCNSNKKTCDDLWVESYPTFMIIEEGDIVYESDDEMTKEECIELAHKQFDVKSRRRRDAEKKFVGKIKEISQENFQSSIASGITIVVFGMSWCQHCQSELELITTVQAQNTFKNVNFALVNCATLTNLELCFDELRNGIPTVNTYMDGNRVVKDSKASNLNQYNNMIKAHVAGGNALEAWKLKTKVKEDSEEY